MPPQFLRSLPKKETKITMRIVALVLVAVTLSLCLGLPVERAEKMSACQPQPDVVSQKGPVMADIDDSDLFFQNALNSRGPERDNSQRIEALLNQMTLAEKVGQMTQLAIGMISKGQDQDIQIDPAKLEKAIVRYGVGSILNVADQALPVDRWQEIIRLIQEVAIRKTRL